jgi:hypothetical protein
MKYIALALASTALVAAPLVAQTATTATTPATAAAGAAAADTPPPAPAAADATTAAAKPNVTAGAQVADASGGAVGTIESVSGANAVLSTGTAKATLPMTAFAQGPNGLVIGMTKAEVEAAVAKASGGGQTAAASGPSAATSEPAAQTASTAPATGTQTAQAAPATGAPSFTVGAAVTDPKGGKVGTVEAVAGNLVTVATATTKAQLPKTAFAQGANGLMIAMTASELEAAVKNAGGAKTSGS